MWPTPSISVADRDYFAAHRDNADLGPFISVPVRNRGSGTWTIYLARRNAKPSDNTDLYEIISWTEPKAAADSDAAAKCKLIPYEQVPTVDS